MERLDLALTALEKKHELVILHEGQKSPMFRNWPERVPDASEVRYWLTKGKNYGVKMDGKVGIDRDLHDRKSYDWLRSEGLYFGGVWTVNTRKGRHDVRRLPEGVAAETRTRLRYAGLPVDFITGRDRFLVGPWSEVAGHRYELTGQIMRTEELPPFPRVDILLQEQRKEVRASIQVALDMTDERAIRYVDKIEPAVSGSGGARQTIVACLKVLSLTGGDLSRAWPLLVRYNARCVPPWDVEAEEGANSLRRKLREARKYWKPR